MVVRIWLLLCVTTIIGRGTASGGEPASHLTSFRADVAPILMRKCQGCHNPKKAAGGLDMSSLSALRRGGKTAGDTILEPGDPDASYLIESIRLGAAPRMPFKQPPLSERDIAVLVNWVKQGAKFDGSGGETTPIASLVDPLAGLPRITMKSPGLIAVTALAFAPDASRLAASQGQKVVLFDAKNGKPSSILEDHPAPIMALCFGPDGKTLVAAGGRAGMFGSVTAWDVVSVKKRFEIRAHSDAILSTAISPDGKTLATTGYDRQILIWDLVAGKIVRVLKEHTDAVHGLSFAPDGKTLASCAGDRTVKLWNLSDGRRLATLSESSGEVHSVSFTPDGQRLVGVAADRSVRIWRQDQGRWTQERSVVGHEGGIIRLAVSPDGKHLATSGDDRRLRIWNLPALEPGPSLAAQPDLVQSLAFSPDSGRLAIGRFDGSLELLETLTGKSLLVLKETARSRPVAQQRGPARNPTLDAPTPRGAARGGKLQLTLTGEGIGRATAVVFREPGFNAVIVTSPKPEPNRCQVNLTIAPGARTGLHQFDVLTPLGHAGPQRFAVSAVPEVAEVEPNEDPSTLHNVTLPATLVGTIGRPGDVDHFRFEAQSGQTLVFQVVAASLGSMLEPGLVLTDARGKSLGLESSGTGGDDLFLACKILAGGTFTLAVLEPSYSGSANHFYRITTGQLPFVRSVFPLGVERGRLTRLHLEGANLSHEPWVSFTPDPAIPAGSVVGVPVALPGGSEPLNAPRVVVAEGPQIAERDGSTEILPPMISVPGGASGRIDRDGDVDLYRFRGRKGERLVIEVFGRRLGSPIDTVIEILDDSGRPVPRAVLLPVDRTEVAFRDHLSAPPGIRLTGWKGFRMGDYLLIGRELARIDSLPRNPDDDCVFSSESGERSGMLETTPEQHPLGRIIYKVEVHPAGSKVSPGIAPPVVMNYRNDDGGRGFSKDSRVTFDVPEDGDYRVRVEDARGQGSVDLAYHLVVRHPRPDFEVGLATENPNICRGGTTLVGVNVRRIDGFDGPIEVKAEQLPLGIRSTPALIERGLNSGTLALSADLSAPAFSPPTWKVIASARPDPEEALSGGEIRKSIDPGGAGGGWITVTPTPSLKVAGKPGRLRIKPGEQVSLILSVDRLSETKKRVPIDVRNLPRGVRVLDIGLNGVLITESQTERTVTVFAEPWVKPQVRPFYAVGKAEAMGTEHASSPMVLEIKAVK